jgi:hypothetical protein
LLELIWIEERDHAPFRHGGLHFTISTGYLLESGLDATVAAQAVAYCLSYVKRYREHSRPAHAAGDSSLHSIT